MSILRQEKYPCPVLFSGHDTACRVSPASRARLYDFLKFPPPQKVSTSCSGFSAGLMEAAYSTGPFSPS